MNVSKINILNVNKTEISPFRGEVSVSENNKQRNKSKEFLYGAGVVSAGILAVALAARAGLFAKILSKNSDKVKPTKLNSDIRETKPPVKIVKIQEEFSTRSILDDYAERFAEDEIDPLRLKSIFDYTKFDINSDSFTQSKFYSQITSELQKMSYEDQYDEFKFLMEFLGNSDSSKLKGTVHIDFNGFKRDNAEKCKKEFTALLDKKPELKDTIFRKYMLQKYLEGCNYETFDKLSNYGERAAFFTNTFNKIIKSGDNLDSEFNKFLDFIKTLQPEKIKNAILFTIGSFPTNKNLDIAKKVISFAKENPQYSDVMVRRLLAYTPDFDFSEKLANAKFRPYQEIQWSYDTHVENMINIRRELLNSGLKCDKTTRQLLRDDWLNPDDCFYNKFNLAFQYSPRLPEVKKVSFEYDISHGLTENEAEELIETITANNNTCKNSTMAVTMNMKLEEMVEKINSAIID